MSHYYDTLVHLLDLIPALLALILFVRARAGG